jgi:uncharacterized membrane-anchored protein YjiN (DUF445 family)
MQRTASGLLVASAGVWGLAHALTPRWPWLGYVGATAEAAVIGGIADWFAVTALFRHPLGIPIPHTAIIPMRKSRIGRSLGHFIQTNFLAPEIIAAQLAGTRPGAKLVAWLANPEHARQIAHPIASGVSGIAETLNDEEMSKSIERGLVASMRSVQVAPILGKILAAIRADVKYVELVDETLRIALLATTQNESIIRDRVRAESPWWVPAAVDARIHDRIIGAIERTLQGAAEDPDHVLRMRFDESFSQLIDNLETSPDMMIRAEVIKESALSHPAMSEFASTIWLETKEALLHRRGAADPLAMERAIMKLADAALADQGLLDRIDRGIVDSVVHVLEPYRTEVAQLIEHTVEHWNADATSNRIELLVGRDLQFVRINGTVVGGLVGLILYSIAQVL